MGGNRLLNSLKLIAFLVCAGLLTGETLVKKFKGKEVEFALKQVEVGSLPAMAQIALASYLDPKFGKQGERGPKEIIEWARHENAPLGSLMDRTFIWNVNCKGCSSFLVEGQRFKALQYGSMALAVTAVPGKDYTTIVIGGTYNSEAKNSIDILPEQYELFEIAPEMAKLEMLPVAEVARKVQHGARWKAGLTAFFGSMATQQVVVQEKGTVSGDYQSNRGNGTFSGSYSGSKTVSVPDEAAIARSRENAATIRRQADQRSEEVIDKLLKANTILPGNNFFGHLYFKRVSSAKVGVLRIPIGQVNFEIVLPLD